MAKITVGNEWIGTTPRQMNVGDFVSDELARNQSQDTITRLDANLQRVAKSRVSGSPVRRARTISSGMRPPCMSASWNARSLMRQGRPAR